ncbi:MAG: exodeoxyribonuclease III [Chthoniobacterales bacterium]
MKIVSWNINSLRKRQERLLAWLAETQPDVVCLQETKCTDEQFPAADLRMAGYHCAFHGQKSYNGVAILSKKEARAVRIGMGDEEDDPQARVIAATIGGVRVFSIYAPNGQAVGSPAYDYKLKWYQRLESCLRREESAAGDLVVCGDFNVAPKDEDVHEPALWGGAIMCSEEERAAFESFCGVGLTDTLRLHHPEAGIFTWWDYRMLAFPKNRGLRIDAVLASESLGARCTASGVEREMRKGKEPSDHAPIWAEFK